MTNLYFPVSTGVCTHEEADTLMFYMLHAVEAAETSTPMTDIRLLTPAGFHNCWHNVKLKPVYDQLGVDKVSALMNWHALAGMIQLDSQEKWKGMLHSIPCIKSNCTCCTGLAWS